MFNSNRRLPKSAVLLTLAIFVTIPVAKCQERESKNVTWAQEFLRTFYPEMIGHRYVMTFTTGQPFDVPVTMGNIRIQIGDFAPGTVIGAATVVNGVVIPRQPKQFITALFTFDRSGHLFTFACEGPSVGKQEEHDRFKEAVRSHDEWTEAQAISELMKAGASYGPKEREKFLAILPLSQLEKLFGSVTVVSSEFESLIEGGPPRVPLFRWALTVSVKFSDGDVGSYKMYFEPFKGALIGMDAFAH
jgi:hypothetical protein